MDRLAEISLSFRGNIEETLDTVKSDLGGVSLALITGEIPNEELSRLNKFNERFEVVTVARFSEQDLDRGIADATVINAASSEEFARSWNRVTRRS